MAIQPVSVCPLQKGVRSDQVCCNIESFKMKEDSRKYSQDDPTVLFRSIVPSTSQRETHLPHPYPRNPLSPILFNLLLNDTMNKVAN